MLKYSVCLKNDNHAVIFEKRNCSQKLENKVWLFQLFLLLFYFVLNFLFSFLLFYFLDAEVLISGKVIDMSSVAIAETLMKCFRI